jgi:nitrogen regulatory protein PII-like uncharacterized protein
MTKAEDKIEAINKLHDRFDMWTEFFVAAVRGVSSIEYNASSPVAMAMAARSVADESLKAWLSQQAAHDAEVKKIEALPDDELASRR